MALQGVVTLNTKAYNPRGTQSGISTWMLTGDASFGGANSVLTESVRGPDKEGQTRARFLLLIPKVATADTSCACIGSPLGKPARVEITVDIPEAFTPAERIDLRTRMSALAAHAIATAAVQDKEPTW